MSYYHYEGQKVTHNPKSDDPKLDAVDDVIEANTTEEAIAMLLQQNIIVTNIRTVGKSQYVTNNRLKRLKKLANIEQPAMPQVNVPPTYQEKRQESQSGKFYWVFIILVIILIATSV